MNFSVIFFLCQYSSFFLSPCIDFVVLFLTFHDGCLANSFQISLLLSICMYGYNFSLHISGASFILPNRTCWVLFTQILKYPSLFIFYCKIISKCAPQFLIIWRVFKLSFCCWCLVYLGLWSLWFRSFKICWDLLYGHMTIWSTYGQVFKIFLVCMKRMCSLQVWDAVFNICALGQYC